MAPATTPALWSGPPPDQIDSWAISDNGAWLAYVVTDKDAPAWCYSAWPPNYAATIDLTLPGHIAGIWSLSGTR